MNEALVKLGESFAEHLHEAVSAIFEEEIPEAIENNEKLDNIQEQIDDINKTIEECVKNDEIENLVEDTINNSSKFSDAVADAVDNIADDVFLNVIADNARKIREVLFGFDIFETLKTKEPKYKEEEVNNLITALKEFIDFFGKTPFFSSEMSTTLPTMLKNLRSSIEKLEKKEEVVDGAKA